MLGAVSCYDYLIKYGMEHCSNQYIQENCCAAVKYVCNGGSGSNVASQLQQQMQLQFGWATHRCSPAVHSFVHTPTHLPTDRPTDQSITAHNYCCRLNMTIINIFWRDLWYGREKKNFFLTYNLCEINLLHYNYYYYYYYLYLVIL